MSNVTLPSGVNKQGRYVHISQVTSGATDLHCPYCAGLLTAKKGRRLAHHFAHTNETCIDVVGKDFSMLDLPLYDRFNIYIDAKSWAELQKFHAGKRCDYRILLRHDPQLIREGFGRYSNYELTHDGKIPFGEATLSKFAEIQMGYVYGRHNQLSKAVQLAYYGKPRFVGYGINAQQSGYLIAPALDQVAGNIADLNIYRSQVQRLYSLDLYLLKIQHAEGVLHKIGVSRDIDRRITEIERDLKPLIEVESIKVDRLCRYRGAVERYALHRYSEHRAEVGPLTEYFNFDKKTLSSVRRDFTSLGDFVVPEYGDWWMPDYRGDTDKEGDYRVDGLIGQILTDEPAWIQEQVEQDQLKQAISEGTKRGMEHAKEQGIHVGRPADTDDEIINKYPDIVKKLQQRQAIRAIARELGVSKNTVRKVRDALRRYG